LIRQTIEFVDVTDVKQMYKKSTNRGA